MKKNLISVIILALLIVNIVLSAVTMFSITSTNRKTAAVVSDIAAALSIELNNGSDPTEETEAAVPIADTQVYEIADSMTIQLKNGEDGKSHYCVVSVSLSMNMKDKDFKKYSATLAEKESLIKNEINDVISGYSIDEAQANTDEMRKEIVKRIQNLFGSEFIYQVSFSDIMFS